MKVQTHGELRMRGTTPPDLFCQQLVPNACVILPKSTHPFHPAHARCGGLSFCRFTDQRTASLPAFHPAETFMTCLTQSGPFNTERVDERNIKAPTDTSKCRPTTSEDALVVFMR